MTGESVAERLVRVRERIAQAQERGGWRHPVTVIAVTKTRSIEVLQTAVAAGLVDLGENRVQEALGKQVELGAIPARWHLIGSLQRNKARQAAGRFDLIHSIDRADLAVELDRRVPAGTRQSVLVEVNCSGEPQKGGVEFERAVELIETVRRLPGLEFAGLMTMAEQSDDTMVQRAAFSRLRALRDKLQAMGVDAREL